MTVDRAAGRGGARTTSAMSSRPPGPAGLEASDVQHHVELARTVGERPLGLEDSWPSWSCHGESPPRSRRRRRSPRAALRRTRRLPAAPLPSAVSTRQLDALAHRLEVELGPQEGVVDRLRHVLVTGSRSPGGSPREDSLLGMSDPVVRTARGHGSFRPVPATPTSTSSSSRPPSRATSTTRRRGGRSAVRFTRWAAAGSSTGHPSPAATSWGSRESRARRASTSSLRPAYTATCTTRTTTRSVPRRRASSPGASRRSPAADLLCGVIKVGAATTA